MVITHGTWIWFIFIIIIIILFFFIHLDHSSHNAASLISSVCVCQCCAIDRVRRYTTCDVMFFFSIQPIQTCLSGSHWVSWELLDVSMCDASEICFSRLLTVNFRWFLDYYKNTLWTVIRHLSNDYPLLTFFIHFYLEESATCKSDEMNR